jgi:hypothetical protein
MEDSEMNGMIEFFYQFGDRHPAVSIRMSPDTALPELLQAFGEFLRGAGYHFNGDIEIVENGEPEYGTKEETDEAVN